jgi:hypothetical protein
MLDEEIKDAIIFEDDAIVNGDFPAVSKEEPFAWLGIRGKVETDGGRLIYNRKVYGSHAYRVHLSLIPFLLHYSTTLSLSVDFYINEVLSLLDIRPLYSSVATTNEFLSKSDIQHFPIVSENSNCRVVVGILLIKVLYELLSTLGIFAAFSRALKR